MLFDPFDPQGLHLKNRAVMSPMTRNRAIGNVPNGLMAQYYAQHASAGLIITEGTSPAANGLGYPRIPGLFDAVQTRGWQSVTDAVHAAGGTIFVQLMHTGRVTHVANLPVGAEVVGPMDGVCPGQMYTDSQGMQPYSLPRPMTEQDIAQAVREFTRSSRRALQAGFDGVELHAANGYLIEQFLNPNVNQRADRYGGSIESRNRFALEVARAVAAEIGRGRLGIRLSPYGVFNSTGPYSDVRSQYFALADELSNIGLLYMHVLDHAAMGAPPVPEDFKMALRERFKGAFILAGGFDKQSAEKALQDNRADLIAFGRPFLANPDLVDRMRRDGPLNTPDMATFYVPGPKGYTDYPTLA
jgi:N-ethylmaleimide reductase